ncbi:MAG: PTS sugar transporter subunit IIA [Rhodothermales bacterium]
MITANISGVHELLKSGAVHVQLPGENKEEVLGYLVDLLSGHASISDFDGVRAAVLNREKIMSTGVGKGLALPHAKTSSVEGIVAAFATTENPIAYDAIDDIPVRMLFLMVSAERAKSQHIKLLSRVSRLMNEDAFRDRLLKATAPEEVLQIFQEGELSLV